jgi:spore maturation protein CgeB
MKILIADTYYPAFVASLYKAQPELTDQSYQFQLDALIGQSFGTSDFYSRHLRALGCEATDIVPNCIPLQSAWLKEQGAALTRAFLKIPLRAYQLPFFGSILSRFPQLLDVVIAQIREQQPDLLYCQDLHLFPPSALADLKKYVRLIVGQIASPLPADEFLKGYDLILTSFPHFVPRLKAKGIASEYFRIGFEASILEKLQTPILDIDVSFVGGISRLHRQAVPTLEYLAENTPIQFFGYGSNALDNNSPILSRHHGEAWGMQMYRTLARSRMTLNRHVDVAENNANNMRLFEATGMGSLLITDRKDNLHDLFEIGKEIVTYSSKEEAAELITYYIAHPAEARAIAQAGQSRTLSEHTYRQRMQELLPILERYLHKKKTEII